MMKKNILLLFTIFLYIYSVNAQKEQKQLIDSSYKFLMESFYDFRSSDTIKAKLYANTYLEKAKNENETEEKIVGIYFKSILKKNDSIYINYLDSLLNFRKNNSNKIYPTILYEMKYRFYFEKGYSDYALKNLILAIESEKRNPNDSLKALLNFRLGLAKLRAGEFDSAIKLYENSINFCDKFPKKCDKYDYCSILLSLSQIYRRLNQFDKSLKYIITLESYANENSLYEVFSYISFRKAKLEFYLDEYEKSSKLFKKAIPGLVEDENFKLVIESFHYLAKINDKLKNLQAVYLYSKKVDSIQKLYNLNSYTLSYSYNNLRNYYRSKNNSRKEIYYLEKLIKAEKKFNKTNVKFKREIVEKYNIPQLIQEKESLIKELENDVKKGNYIKYSLTGISIISLLIIVSFYVKQFKLKKQFNLVFNQKNNEILETENKSELNLPKEVVDNILQHISDFEINYKFLDKNSNLNTLAKKFETNSNYLSKIINHHKGNNFSKYLSNLRINYILDLLKENKKIRKYTIKAIAEEAGFKNAESFSNAFFKKTGLKPSYYIRQLNKKTD